MKYYQRFAVTGVINVTTLDAGITSNEKEIKTVTGIVINFSTQLGNDLVMYVRREIFGQIPDYCLDTREAAGAANAYKSVNKTIRIPVDRKLDVGETLQVGVLCGAVANNISGAYEYEITGA